MWSVKGENWYYFIVGSSRFHYHSLVLFAIFRDYVLVFGHKEGTLDLSLDPSVSESLAPPPLLSQEPSSGHPFLDFTTVSELLSCR